MKASISFSTCYDRSAAQLSSTFFHGVKDLRRKGKGEVNFLSRFKPDTIRRNVSAAVNFNSNGRSLDVSVAESFNLITGGANDFKGATDPLVIKHLECAKKIVLVRHGLSSWNSEGRIQGSSNSSILSHEGIKQAHRCKSSLSHLHFDKCFSSPISRAKSSAEIIWEGRDAPLIFLDSLKEANLLFLEGMSNSDAKEQFPELYRMWREDPAHFHVDGVYPVVQLWSEAKLAWKDILEGDGENILVITHKSIMRALLCTAIGLGPEKFRAVDLNNGGVCIFSVSQKGEPMLQALNLTSHLLSDDVFYTL